MELRRQYFGLNHLDQKMEAFLDFDRGFFVELGANDGVAQSNTLYFEKYRGWRGVLIEPSQMNFFKCRANRAPETKSYCAACVPFGYTERFVPVTYANLMSVSEMPGSDLPDISYHLEKSRQFLQPYETHFTYGAEARTLNELLIHAGAPSRIDFLSLDVEGVEMPVLKGIDHDRFRFRFMLVECRSVASMSTYLESVGYEFQMALSAHDFLYRDARA
jgi:FkbM family methyltransferase